jgi:uncharacterized protein YajQ (UPF0234 family)
MAQQNSFDIVSQVDSAEIANALNQTIKEVRQRFDFKGSSANVVHEKNELVLTAEDETKLRNMNDILQQKAGAPWRAVESFQLRQDRTGRRRHRATARADSGRHPAGESQRGRKFIKDSKAKVQASIQGDIVRVSGRDRDTLQDIIAS